MFRVFFRILRRPPLSPCTDLHFPSTPLCRSPPLADHDQVSVRLAFDLRLDDAAVAIAQLHAYAGGLEPFFRRREQDPALLAREPTLGFVDRKSTRLKSSH